MSGIKKKDLEIELERVPSHPDPKPHLEQYPTPPSIASDILFTAYSYGHVKGRKVADLGCGTGIFAIGSAYLGASDVIGVDIDTEAIELAKEEAKNWSLSDAIKFANKDIDEFETEVDTVIMNPPFGSQNKGADIPFLEKSFEIGEIVYSLHNAKTAEYLRNFIKERSHSLFWEKRYMFDINNLFEFHEKEQKSFEVILLGIEVKR